MEREPASIFGTIALALVIGFGVAVVTTAEDSAKDNFDQAVAKAQYLARQGIMERGLSYLRSLKPNQLPNHRVDLPSGENSDGERYQGVYVAPDQEIPRSRANMPPSSYIIGATGVADFVDASGATEEVRQTESTRAFRVSFASFMHVTDSEHSIFGEHMMFPVFEDTVFGNVHSNDFLRFFSYTIFAGHVSTSQPYFVVEPPGGNPVFVNYPPEFNAPLIVFPEQAEEARRCATSAGLSFDGEGRYYFRLVFRGSDGFWILRSVIGAPPSDTVYVQFPVLFDVPVFFDAPLELEGTVDGRYTIAASGDIRLLEDVIYSDSQPNGEIDPHSLNMLGIISESNILIANTPENGRWNSSQGLDIIINAALLALNSFTFEDQNDTWDIYSGPSPDDRGVVRLWGSTAQRQRGYVHRSNHGSTGYGRDYHYDPRFSVGSPPCFETVIAEMGYSQFNIESWGAE